MFMRDAVGYAWTRYRIPFKRPLVTAHGTFRYREGAIIEVTDSHGFTGVGEIAPPPGFGISLDDALAPLIALGSNGRYEGPGLFRDIWPYSEWKALPPATRFGLETAKRDCSAQMRDEEAAEAAEAAEAPEAAPPEAPDRVRINATVAAVDVDEAVQAACEAISKGISCVKLKVGTLSTVDDETARVAALRSAIGPDIHLRIDANEAWGYEQALAILQAVAQYDIQYCEQPVARDDLVAMYCLRREQPIPIAADEAVTDLASVRHVLEAKAADVVVLKPQCCGDIWDILRSMQEVVNEGVAFVWTSSIEAGIGVCAGISSSQSHGKYPESGFYTLDLLEDDLILVPPELINGELVVPPRNGMLDYEALVRYAI